MIDYTNEILSEFNKSESIWCGIDTSSVPEDLYKVDDDCEKLSPEKANMFHNLVAKTLYTTKQSRKDTCTALDFITSRVREHNKYYWVNLVHLMKYIRVE